jgi:hypothetical protein
MSVRDRIEDSKLLFNAGRLEGALISVLLAAAATSRKRYPDRKTMRDRAAFEQFLTDERPKVLGGLEVNIEFGGEMLRFESLLYRFVRSSLVHESQLEDSISFDYGDFLLDKRGTTDHFTFSSELVIRLAFAVETAPENKGLFPEGRYDRLPEPTLLKRNAVIKYRYGEQSFEVLSWACSVVSEVWEDTGECLNWLHLKGRQAFRDRDAGRCGVKLLIPTKYITSIEQGQRFRRSRIRTSPDVGVFAPDRLAPQDALDIAQVERAINELQIPMVETMLTIRRPHYDLTRAPEARFTDACLEPLRQDGPCAK